MFRRIAFAPRFAAVMSYSSLPSLKYPAELPKLSFDWKEGVAPVLTPRQVELHYTKHHKAYVDKLNTLVKGKDGSTIESLLIELSSKPDQKVAFNQAAQHFNHTFYWNCLTPNGTPIPPAVESALKESFGSVEKFKEAFLTAAANNFGSGWTWLCVDPAKNGALVLDNTSNAGCPLTAGLRPVLCVDVWEHAYYKDFENRRPDYLKEFWGIVNWKFVAEQLEAARKP